MVTPEEIREQAMVFVRAGDELTASLLRDLASQVESLQADADRYRWLRLQHWSESKFCVVASPKNAVKLGYDCPSTDRLDDAIDEARKQS